MTEPDESDADPTVELDSTTELNVAKEKASSRGRDLDRVDQGAALRFMARRVIVWAVPLVLVGILLVGLGLPVWVIVVALATAMAIVVFEFEL